MLILIEHTGSELEAGVKEFSAVPVEGEERAAMYHWNFRENCNKGTLIYNDREINVFIIVAGYGNSWGLAIADYLNILKVKEYRYLDEMVVGIGCWSPSYVFEKKTNLRCGLILVPHGVFDVGDGADTYYHADREMVSYLEADYHGNACGVDGIRDLKKDALRSWAEQWIKIGFDHPLIDYGDYSSVYMARAAHQSHLRWASIGYVREIYIPKFTSNVKEERLNAEKEYFRRIHVMLKKFCETKSLYL
jgi:hypothetical protein